MNKKLASLGLYLLFFTWTATVSCAALSSEDKEMAALLPAMRMSAEKGDPEAQYLLGFFYFTGNVVSRDLNQAKFWLTKAAESGDPRAQNCLGLIYDPEWFGSRADLENKTAMQWYNRAAAQGYPSAIHNLSAMKPSPELPQTNPTPAPLVLNKARLTDELSQIGPQTPQSIFKHSAPAVVEIIGVGNYGSGVIAGTYDSELETSQSTVLAPMNKHVKKFEFFSKHKKQRENLTGRFLLVFTNAHVLEGSNKVTIGIGSTSAGETLIQVTPDAACLPAASSLDLAILFIPIQDKIIKIEQNIASLQVYSEKNQPEKGSRVFAIGNPERLVRTITQGLYNGIRPEGIQFDAPISHGSSGGALVDEKNRLLGITSGFLSEKESQNLNFAVPYPVLEKALSGQGMNCYTP